MNTHQSKEAKRTVKLGSTGPEVFQQGPGCMGRSGMDGSAADDRSPSHPMAGLDSEC